MPNTTLFQVKTGRVRLLKNPPGRVPTRRPQEGVRMKSTLSQPGPARRSCPRIALAALLAVLPLAAAPQSRTGKGIDVEVTPEMTGAGVVSSGAKLPSIPPVTGNRKNPVPSWGKPLPYPILIADRRNNRLIEIAPDKSIVWEFPSPALKVYRGNEDVSFSPDGKRLAVSEEDNFDVHIVDYEQRALTWTWGTPDTRGLGDNLLNYPDDAHLLADGIFVTADIRNCRVLFVDPKQNKIVNTWGQPGKCRHNPPHQLGNANGVTDMENGDILVTEIKDAWISRITRAGKVVWSVKAPNIHYPSDAFPTVDGKQVIVADFWKPGRVVIFDPLTRKITWEFFFKDGEKMLDHSSIAMELPGTGDVLVVGHQHHPRRVGARKTKEIIWQYGELGKKGFKPGLLNYPDGVDIDVFRDWKAALKK
jgi:hypothetical protein